MQGIALLGATGSIGTSTLNVLARHRDRFRLVAAIGGRNGEALDTVRRAWAPALAGLAEANPDCVLAAALHPDASIVVNAVVGFAGLRATVAALEAGKRVCLANKESLVAGGHLVLDAARRGGGELVPVDSEHSAILQCLTGAARAVDRLTVTASGGPFRAWPAERLGRATVEDALAHPTWRMGRKITVDSATLVNKALEIIEAHYLFGLPYDRLDVVVHPQSIVHALIEFTDGSVLAQMGFPTMELPILYALTHPERLADAGIRRFDPVAASPLTFEPVAHDRFPALRLGLEAGRAGGAAPAVFNAANEAAVEAFLAGRIGFLDVARVIDAVLARELPRDVSTLDAVQATDAWARAVAQEAIG